MLGRFVGSVSNRHRGIVAAAGDGFGFAGMTKFDAVMRRMRVKQESFQLDKHNKLDKPNKLKASPIPPPVLRAQVQAIMQQSRARSSGPQEV